MIYLSFDFGWSSWGCAVGDDITGTVQAVGAVSAKGGVPQWDRIDALLDEGRPGEFVIGYPLKLDGSRFKLTDQVDVLIAQLRKRYPDYPLHCADERLSTVYAKERLYEKKGRKGLEKSAIDAESASLILEQWLEARNL